MEVEYYKCRFMGLAKASNRWEMVTKTLLQQVVCKQQDIGIIDGYGGGALCLSDRTAR